MARIIVVDDHPAIRMAVSILLKQDGHEIIAETNNGVDAVTLTRQHLPDIVVLDIGLPKLDGLTVITKLKLLTPKTKILVLTAQPPDLFAVRCMKAGANGFVTKDESLNELQRAIKVLLAGYSFFPEDTLVSEDPASLNVSEENLLRTLSNREMMILRSLALGKKNMEIAKDLFLSHKTVSTYKTRLLQKLNAKSLLDLIEIAKRNGV